MDPSTVERLARDTPGEFAADKAWLHAFAAAVRREALEEAAKIAERTDTMWPDNAIEDCVRAIRALKG